MSQSVLLSSISHCNKCPLKKSACSPVTPKAAVLRVWCQPDPDGAEFVSPRISGIRNGFLAQLVFASCQREEYSFN